MDCTKTGGPAFPIPGSGYNSTEPVPGMTLLDHFAGLAMQGLEANSRIDQDLEDVTPHEAMRIMARSAYAMAAAMIAERERIMNAE